MSEADENKMNIEVDRENLFKEEVYTDLKTISLRILVPVKPDGSEDESRTRQFVGQTHIMSGQGPIPLDCPIEATNLEEALDQFPEAAQAAMDKMIERVQEMQREQASKIVVPGQEQSGGLIV